MTDFFEHMHHDVGRPLRSSLGSGPRGNGIFLSNAQYDYDNSGVYEIPIADFKTDQHGTKFLPRVGDVILVKTLLGHLSKANLLVVTALAEDQVVARSRAEWDIATQYETPDDSVTGLKLVDQAVIPDKIADEVVESIAGANAAYIAITTHGGTFLVTAADDDGTIDPDAIGDDSVEWGKLKQSTVPTMSTTVKGLAKVGPGLAMTSDGKLELDGNGDIATAVTAWLNAHPEATTTVQDNSLTTAKYIDRSITMAKLADSVSNVIDTTSDEASKLSDTGITSLTSARWMNGGVQLNTSMWNFGYIISANSGIVMWDRLYADRDIQVWCDAGWEMNFVPYSADSDSSCIFGQSGYTYSEIVWKQILLIPQGVYFRMVLRKRPTDASDVLDPVTDRLHVHLIKDSYASVKGENDLSNSIKWKLGKLSAGVPNWADSTHLLSADILVAEKPIKVTSDDSIVRPYANYYDENGTYLGYSRLGMIPAGARFRLDLNIMDGSTQGHYGMVEALRLEEMDENFIWYGTSNNSGAPSYADNRIMQCMSERHDQPVVLSLPDYSKYMVGANLKADGEPISAFDYEPLYSGPVGVPAGQWHHVYMGKLDNTAFTDAEVEEAISLLRIGTLQGYGSAIDGIRDDVSVLKRRVTALEGEAIPSYYEDGGYSLSDRISDVLDAMPKPVESVAQFAFSTDFHATEFNQQFKTRALLNKLMRETHCTMYVNGGDVVDGKLIGTGLVSSIDFAKQMQEYSNWLVPDGCNLSLTVAGNHDGGASWNPTGDALIDEQTLYELSTFGRAAGNVTLDPCGKLQMYVDDPYRKIRWIVASYGNTTNIGKWDETQGHGVLGESKSDCLSFVGWALDTMDDGWTAVVFNHILINSWSGGPQKGAASLESICDMYNARGNGTLESRLFDFSDSRGEVACIIGGHLHLDYDYETAGGIPCIVTTTDNCGAQCRINDQDNAVMDTSLRPAGTWKEQAFDVFTIDTENRTISTVRIGYGVDRSWTY